MSAADPDPDDMLAAEYALGTLDGMERAAATARLAQDPAFASAVAAWEHRLAPLLDAARDIEPPPHLWPLIVKGIGGTPVAVEDASSNATALAAHVIRLERGMRRWRSAAGAMTALAACLAVALTLAGLALDKAPSPSLVAVLQGTSNPPPAYLVKASLPDRSLSVQAIHAAVPAGHSYELWLVDPAAGAPRSLGLMDAAVSRHALPAGLSPEVLARATYAVTEEPPGGSPDGKPSGAPIYAGRLTTMTP